MLTVLALDYSSTPIGLLQYSLMLPRQTHFLINSSTHFLVNYG